MATYKLIQDIEAEDHILGPLTLRQFIFALIGVFCWYLSFIAFVRHIYFFLVITLPPGLFFTFFAIPFGRDQPTEVWALGKLHFWFRPRRRIWDQSGVKELVTITVPKKVERVLTKGFSQSEVQSRLKALANTLDSRGWAVKNVGVGTPYSSPGAMGQTGSDRLLDIGTAPQEVPSYDVQASDDILDEVSNPVAQQFQSMITQSTKDHRKHIIDEMNEISAGQAAAQATATASGQSGGWFMSPPSSTLQVASSTPSVPALHKSFPKPQQLAYSHMRTLQPIGQGSSQPAVASDQQITSAGSGQQASDSGAPSGAGAPDPAILSLANNNDLNVSTIAREAYKARHDDEPPQDEVVVSLH